MLIDHALPGCGGYLCKVDKGKRANKAFGVVLLPHSVSVQHGLIILISLHGLSHGYERAARKIAPQQSYPVVVLPC